VCEIAESGGELPNKLPGPVCQPVGLAQIGDIGAIETAQFRMSQEAVNVARNPKAYVSTAAT